MPRRNGISLKALRRRGDEWDWEVEEPEPEQEPPPAALVRSRRLSSRIAVTAMFTTLFFAGAAFTAGAGDRAAKIVEGDGDAAIAELYGAAGDPAAAETVVDAVTDAATAVAEPETAPASGPTAEVPAAEVPAEPVSPPASDVDPAAAVEVATEDAVPTPTTPTPASTPAARAPAGTPAKAALRATPPPVKPRATKKWIVKRAKIAPASSPEIEHDEHTYGEPTVWLNRALPDPTPPSARLTRSFAHELVSAAKRHDADWAAVLGVLRAQGERGPAPATAADLDSLASRLAGGQAWRGALALSGRTGFADRAEALADLYRSIGIETLVTGYVDSRGRLAKRLLDNESVLIYSGGREDIAAGRIDVRVLVLLGYLAERHGSIAVSSLFSGHRKFARPGVVSAHVYGHAVDVAAVDGTSIAGHQQPGGLTEAAVRSILLLPTELQPQQVISLLGLGGPSFPMRDHGDHIHVGY
jgi:hypothetical protein